MTDTPAIETSHLYKAFGSKIAVEDLSLSVRRGEAFGFLGPNGAGKTTSVKMLLGLVQPTRGQGTILGTPIGRPEVRAKVGFLPEHFRFHDWLTGSEFLHLHANLYKMDRQDAENRIGELLELVGLQEHTGQKLREYSKGMLQRIGLAQALLNRPELVILDEPTSGLDPIGRRLVRDIIHDLRDQGATVFLNSHLLSEIEITCDRVAFIKHGKVIQTGDLQSLVAGETSVEIRAHNLTPAILEGLERWSRKVECEDDLLTLSLESEAGLPDITRYLASSGVDVFAMQPHRISLEELFVEIVGTDGGL
jgi:ABC-2 type transport system ATP-binding protein